MVFFTCDACGESLKKNAVEKHYQFQCRNCSVLSCVDCGKDFPGDAYKLHTSCISEEAKYSGKDYKPKPNANKGETKQLQWTEQVQKAIAKGKAEPRLKTLLERLMDYPNIPRKKAKFQNFIKNSLGVRDTYLCERTWDLIAAEMPQNQPPQQQPKPQQPSADQTNGHTATAPTATQKSENSFEESEDKSAKKLSKRELKEERRKQQSKEEKKNRKSEDDQADKKKKRKRDVESEDGEEPVKKKKKKKKQKDEQNGEDVVVNGTEQENGETDATEETPTMKFTWEGAIIGALRRADDHELSLKKLRKKVIAEYHVCAPNNKGKTEEDLLAKFNKKVNKNSRLRVHKDRVKLLH